MRTMYDSVTARDIPPYAAMVAGYVDGRYRWTDADWALFPDAVRARIAVFAATNDGHVLDVEDGAASPDQLPGWLVMRRAAGVDPSAYVNRSNWQACIDACSRVNVAAPHWWLAAYDGVAEIPAGTVAKQYANPAIIGAHYDLSSVADFWPGIDEVKIVDELPQRVGQSADVIIAPGEVTMLQAFFRYPNGQTRNIVRKVWGHKVGRYVELVRPPVDPDADETVHLDAEPAIFVVDVLVGG